MKKVKIPTSYNVPIEYTLAGVGDRVIANILDMIIKGLYVLTFLLIFYYLGQNENVFLYLVFGFPVLIYNPLCEVLLQGQTPGMRIRKIKVISLNGKQTSVGQYMTRWLFRLVDVSISTGAVALISIASTKDGQRLGDIAAGTTVVKTDSEVKFNNTIYAETNEQYSVKFPEVHLLSDNEIEIIREALDDYSKNKKNGVLEILAKKVKEKLVITTDLNSHKFLNTILKDYNHHFSNKI